MIGGLIISFSYIVRVRPNWRNFSFNLRFISLIRRLYVIEKIKINSNPQTNVLATNEYLNVFISWAHYKWTLYLFIILIMVLFYVDKVLGSVKNYHR
jgi:hypothetical protein